MGEIKSRTIEVGDRHEVYVTISLDTHYKEVRIEVCEIERNGLLGQKKIKVSNWTRRHRIEKDGFDQLVQKHIRRGIALALRRENAREELENMEITVE